MALSLWAALSHRIASGSRHVISTARAALMVISVAAHRTFRPYFFFVPLLSHNFLGLRAARPVDRPGGKQPFL
jgi:hypothetical protein